MITNMFHQLCLYQLWYFILLPIGIQYPSKPLFRRLLMISGGLGEPMVGRRRQVKSKHGFFLITYAGQKTERACLIHTYQLHRAHVYMYSCTPVGIPVWARLSWLRYAVWHYWQWSFKTWEAKLKRFLHKNKYSQEGNC